MITAAIVLAGALMAQAAEPASKAEPPVAATTSSAKPPAAAKPEKVCVTEPVMGSHFKKKICATPEEWERRRLADQAAMSRTGGKAACSRDGC